VTILKYQTTWENLSTACCYNKTDIKLFYCITCTFLCSNKLIKFSLSFIAGCKSFDLSRKKWKCVFDCYWKLWDKIIQELKFKTVWSGTNRNKLPTRIYISSTFFFSSCSHSNRFKSFERIHYKKNQDICKIQDHTKCTQVVGPYL